MIYTYIGTAVTARDSNQPFNDYSYITAANINVNPLVIARCITGMGPSNNDDNSELGGWYFRAEKVLDSKCNDSNVIESSGAAISDYTGVIDLLQCADLTIFSEGVYTCMIDEGATMVQSMRLGVYLTGRSELHIIRMYI